MKDKIIEGIVDLCDELNRNGIRIIIDIKKGEVLEIILNKFYR